MQFSIVVDVQGSMIDAVERIGIPMDRERAIESRSTLGSAEVVESRSSA